MKIRYRKLYYKVGLKEFIIIEKEKIILLLKRLYRGFKRALQHLQPLIIVILLSIIYILITYFGGNFLGKSINIIDAIWDARELIFSSLIIVFAVDFTAKERQRRQNLKEQYTIMESLVYHSNYFLNNLLRFLNIEYDKEIFLSEHLYNQFMDYFDKINLPKKIDNTPDIFNCNNYWIDNLLEIYKEIINNINQQKFFLGKHDDTNIYNSLTFKCKKIKKSINKNYSPAQLQDEIIQLSREMLLSCAFLRRIWVWDYDRNQKIRNILLNNLQPDDKNYYEISKWF